jgi:hypothetical protein
MDAGMRGLSMNKAATAVFFFLPAMLVSTTKAKQPEQHAPTAEQCRADRDLWMSEMKDASAKDALSSHTLGNRQREMTVCMTVIDPKPSEPPSYDLVEARALTLSKWVVAQTEYRLALSKWHNYIVLRLVFAEELENRLIEFIARHGLTFDDAEH